MPAYRNDGMCIFRCCFTKVPITQLVDTKWAQHTKPTTKYALVSDFDVQLLSMNHRHSFHQSQWHSSFFPYYFSLYRLCHTLPCDRLSFQSKYEASFKLKAAYYRLTLSVCRAIIIIITFLSSANVCVCLHFPISAGTQSLEPATSHLRFYVDIVFIIWYYFRRCASIARKNDVEQRINGNDRRMDRRQKATVGSNIKRNSNRPTQKTKHYFRARREEVQVYSFNSGRHSVLHCCIEHNKKKRHTISQKEFIANINLILQTNGLKLSCTERREKKSEKEKKNLMRGEKICNKK